MLANFYQLNHYWLFLFIVKIKANILNYSNIFRLHHKKKRDSTIIAKDIILQFINNLWKLINIDVHVVHTLQKSEWLKGND